MLSDLHQVIRVRLRQRSLGHNKTAKRTQIQDPTIRKLNDLATDITFQKTGFNNHLQGIKSDELKCCLPFDVLSI